MAAYNLPNPNHVVRHPLSQGPFEGSLKNKVYVLYSSQPALLFPYSITAVETDVSVKFPPVKSALITEFYNIDQTYLFRALYQPIFSGTDAPLDVNIKVLIRNISPLDIDIPAHIPLAYLHIQV